MEWTIKLCYDMLIILISINNIQKYIDYTQIMYTVRFNGDSIRSVLPLIFVHNQQETQNLFKDEMIKKYIKQFDEVVIDAKFEQFYQLIH